MSPQWQAHRLKGAVQCILRQDFELQELQGRECDLLRRTLVLELGNNLTVGSLPQTEVIGIVPKADGYSLLLIDGAAGKYRERRQVIRLGDGKLRMPDRSVGLKANTVARDVQADAEREIITQQKVNLLAGKQRALRQGMKCLHLAGMEIEASNALCLVANGKEDSQPALLQLLVNEELRKTPIDLVLRVAVRTEQLAVGADALVKGALRLG